MEMPDEDLAWAAELALELRRRVKEQQAFIGAAEFGKTDLSYRVGDRPEKIVYCEETVRASLGAEGESESQGSVHAIDSEVLPEPDPDRGQSIGRSEGGRVRGRGRDR